REAGPRTPPPPRAGESAPLAGCGPMADEPRICDPGGRGMFFPGTQAEHEWSPVLRAVLYAAALVYLFYGVNIGADKFMSSIEEITSKKRAVVSKTTGRIVTVQ
ncbi:unnamed protein product, partial [Prorocentrum cordatum]